MPEVSKYYRQQMENSHYNRCYNVSTKTKRIFWLEFMHFELLEIRYALWISKILKISSVNFRIIFIVELSFKILCITILQHSAKYCWALFYQHGLTLILAWISNYTHYNVWNQTTYPFLNFNGATVELHEWRSNFNPHFTEHVIIYPYCDLN